MKRAVFLDRDGVINRALIRSGMPTPPHGIEEIEILSGVKESLSLLNEHDFEIVVITNQPDARRGLVTQDSIMQINEFLGASLGLKHFYICFHDDSDNCKCRKPEPGLIIEAAKDLGIDLSQSAVVGDRWRDVSAGQAAGCKTFFIDYSYPEKKPEKPYTVVSSLLEVVLILTGEQHAAK